MRTIEEVIKEISDNAQYRNGDPTYLFEGYDVEKALCEILEIHKKEKPRGEWIEGKNGNIKCNQCECEIRYSYLIGNKPDFPKFCPDCGADMRRNTKRKGTPIEGNNESYNCEDWIP